MNSSHTVSTILPWHPSTRFNRLPLYRVGTVVIFLRRRPISGMLFGVKLLLECYTSSKEQPNVYTSTRLDALRIVNSASGVGKSLRLLHFPTLITSGTMSTALTSPRSPHLLHLLMAFLVKKDVKHCGQNEYC